MKKCMHKIENMPLQTSSIFSCPGQMSQSAGACFSSNLDPCGQRKICKCPTPGTDKAGKCPAEARGRGGGVLVEAGID